VRFAAAIIALLGFGAWGLAGCSESDQPGARAVADDAPHGDTARSSATARSPASGVPAGDDAAATGDPSFETVLAPLHDVEIFARLAGMVMSLGVEEGRRVAPGDTLARLDDREQRATLAEWEAQVEQARAAWERAQRLHEQKVIADEPYIGARSELQAAEARRDRAKVEWERCTVCAPIAGVVTQRRVQVGQMVKENDLLFRVSDPDRLRAELLLPETLLGTVHSGQRVRLLPAAGSPTIARLSHVSSLVDPASGTFRAFIDLDNRRARLPAGISARVVFEPSPASTR
jgi:RND family efflux transporter MFP subunit